MIKNNLKKECYINSVLDFYGQKIKFKARAGCLGLNTDLERWGKTNGRCTACSLNQSDTIEHRLLLCPSDVSKRFAFHDKVLQVCGSEVLNNYLQLDPSTKIEWLLGDGVLCTWGQDTFTKFDKCSKEFLVNMYSDIKERMHKVLQK